LFNSLEPTLRTNLQAKIDRDAHVMVVWMTLVSEIRSESYRYFENVKSKLKNLKLADFPGENVKDFTQAFTLLSDELETANLMEPHFLILFINALAKTEVQMFMFAMSALLTRALNYNRTVRFLTPEARTAMPPEQVMSIRKARGEADPLYQELLEGGDWTAQRTAGDRQGAPASANMVAETFSEAQINALVQKAFEKGALSKGNSAGTKDISQVECFECHELGHYANKCPQRKTTNWHKKASVSGEAEVKTIKKDGEEDVIYYWCAKCRRWTTSHNTLKHGQQGSDPVPPPAVANMAMLEAGANALVLEHEFADDDDEGAWTTV
jgi:hypothetical protein